ncbi:MAG TPA: proline dehydrogenase family protein [Thermoplasmata archaeon]|nr:proline dehydrogenase family protein [Thermoplasmata archaeon]
MGLLIRFAGQWVAGEALEDVVRATKAANERGLAAILNLLGEHYKEKSQVEATLREYLLVLDAIEAQGLDASVSIKPSQFGLEFGRAYCESMIVPVFDRVRAMGDFLWLDMESSRFTEDTIRMYEELRRRHHDVGVCLQANLRRSERDLDRLLEIGGKIRLVKGAYREGEEIAYRSPQEVDAAYGRLLKKLFEAGDHFAVGTHDGKFIDEAIRLSKTHKRIWEFQMLMGVREPMKRELAKQGYSVAEYIPYGPNWLPYFLRRLRERPRNILTMIRSFVQG